VLGTAAKIEVSKESTTIVGDGSSEVRFLFPKTLPAVWLFGALRRQVARLNKAPAVRCRC
jgi:hypothetical protein